MSPTRKPSKSAAWLGTLTAALAVSAAAVAATPVPGRTILVVAPAGPKDIKTVTPYLNSFLDYLEAHEKVPTGTYNAYYRASLEKGEKALKSRKSGFAMLTLGLYLKYRDSLGLKLIAGLEIDGKRHARVNVVALDPALAGKPLSSLAGKRLAWNRFDDPAFVAKVVLGGHGFGDHFTEVRVPSAVTAVRKLVAGEADLALLTEKETAAAKKLPGAAGLQIVQSSIDLPLPPVVALDGVASAADITGIRKALHSMCTDPKGRSVCEDFKITRFAAAKESDYAKVSKLYAAK